MFQALLTYTLSVALGLLLVLLVLLLLPISFARAIKAFFVHALWQRRHGKHGRHWLAVYSDGKRWKEHFETVVLPMLGPAVCAVNISHDPSWNQSRRLERQAHRHWGGKVDHTPILIYLPTRFRSIRQVRFHQAYLARSRKGQEGPLEQQLHRLRGLLDEA
jgi:hypothetical protein